MVHSIHAVNILIVLQEGMEACEMPHWRHCESAWVLKFHLNGQHAYGMNQFPLQENSVSYQHYCQSTVRQGRRRCYACACYKAGANVAPVPAKVQ